MLKHLAILGLLCPLITGGILACQDAAKGTPEQRIAKQEPGKKGQEQPEAKNNNQSTTKSVPPGPQPSPPSSNQTGQGGSEDRQINLWLVYFTGALVIVGILQFGGMFWQALLLRKTRMDVGRQADWMEKQAGHMVSQLDKMQRQADTMKEQNRASRERERARISIYDVWPPMSFSPVSEEMKPNIPIKIEMTIINDGYSMAFNIRARGHTSIIEFVNPEQLNALIDDREDWYDLAIPGIIRTTGIASKTQIVMTQMAGVLEEEYEPVERQTMNAVYAEKLSLTIAGEIVYEDIFGDEHRTPFWFLWVSRGGDVMRGNRRIGGSWIDLSGKAT